MKVLFMKIISRHTNLPKYFFILLFTGVLLFTQVIAPVEVALAVPANDASTNPDDWQPETRAARWSHATGLYNCVSNRTDEVFKRSDIESGEWYTKPSLNSNRNYEAGGYIGLSGEDDGKSYCNDIVAAVAKDYNTTPLKLFCEMGGAAYTESWGGISTNYDTGSCLDDRSGRDMTIKEFKKSDTINKMWGSGGLPSNAGGAAYYMLNYKAFTSAEGCNAAKISSQKSGDRYYTTDTVDTTDPANANPKATYFSGIKRSDQRKVYTSYPGLNEQNRACSQIASDIKKYAPDYAAWVRNHVETPTAEAGTGTSGDGEDKTSCIINGVGWIVCTVANFIADVVDRLYGLMEIMLKIPPIDTDITSGTNAIYNVWGNARSFANVLFVIAFLVIIYSQITGAGISNYGIKNLLPRLILVAILVNVSYWICAILVDISNIMGHSIYAVLENVRDNMNLEYKPQWTTVVAGLLAAQAGTLTAAGGVVAVSAAAAAGFGPAMAYLVLPLVLGAVLAVIIAIFVLVARQALVVALILVAPIAFCAYLLPNTEKFFQTWKKAFITMLVFYPLFSLVFGAAQIAGLSLIAASEGASAVQQPVLILMGMGVQVMPLIATPLLVKFSGGLISGVANGFNNRGKGLLSKASRLSRGAAKYNAMKTLSGNNQPKTRFGQRLRSSSLGQLGTSIATRAYGWKKTHDTNLKTYGEQADDTWAQSTGGRQAIDALESAQIQKKITEAEAKKRHLEANVNLHLKADVADIELKDAKAGHDTLVKELSSQAGEEYHATELSDVSRKLQQADRNIRLNEQRTNSAARMSAQEFAAAMRDGESADPSAAAVLAGGIDPSGANRVVAQAIDTQDKARQEAIGHEVSRIYEGSTPDTLVNDASAALKEANAAGDAVRARAAAKILGTQTGSKGIDVLDSAIRDIESSGGLHADVDVGLRYDVSAAGLKGKNSSLDQWSRAKGAKLSDVAIRPDTVSRLNEAELAGQSEEQLREWVANGVLSPAQASSVMDAHEKGTIHLDPKKLEIFGNRS